MRAVEYSDRLRQVATIGVLTRPVFGFVFIVRACALSQQSGRGDTERTRAGLARANGRSPKASLGLRSRRRRAGDLNAPELARGA